MEPVAEAEMRVDHRLIRQRGLELGPQLVDVDVHAAVAGAQLAAPRQGVELLARDDPSRALDEDGEQLQLAPRDPHRLPTREDEPVSWVDLQVARAYGPAVAVGVHRCSA